MPFTEKELDQQVANDIKIGLGRACWFNIISNMLIIFQHIRFVGREKISVIKIPVNTQKSALIVSAELKNYNYITGNGMTIEELLDIFCCDDQLLNVCQNIFKIVTQVR